MFDIDWFSDIVLDHWVHEWCENEWDVLCYDVMLRNEVVEWRELCLSKLYFVYMICISTCYFVSLYWLGMWWLTPRMLFVFESYDDLELCVCGSRWLGELLKGILCRRTSGHSVVIGCDIEAWVLFNYMMFWEKNVSDKFYLVTLKWMWTFYSFKILLFKCILKTFN